MWTDGNNNFCYGDCPPGWREPTPGEIAAYNTARIEAQLKQQAYAQLVANDRVAIRCVKAGIAYPQGWKDYDAALMAIYNDPTGCTSLPAPPVAPSGTEGLFQGP